MQRPLGWFARAAIGCALGTVALVHAPESSAQRAVPTIEVRSVSVRSAPALTPMLRAAVEEAIASIEVGRARGGFVLDVTVTRMSRVELAVGQRIDCEVSVVVEDARRHAVRGILTGRSHVVGDSVDQLENAAVRAAARGALRSLPSARGG